MQLVIENDKNFLQQIPEVSGCYIFRSKDSQVIYVGKALNLRKRVKQYFEFNPDIKPSDKLEPKKKIMVRKSKSIEVIFTDSEIEAFILETNLIKKYKPRYNKLMVDDKNYSFIKFTNEDFPKIKFVREKIKDGSVYFGPYPNSFPAKETIKRLRKLFPYRSCNRKMQEVSDNGKLKVISSDTKPCLYYHLGLCNAPCASLELKKAYRYNINQIKSYLRSEKPEIISNLENKMLEHSKNLEFEKASEIRDRINNLKYITQRVKVSEKFDETAWKKYLAERNKIALSNLNSELSKRGIIEPTNNLGRIECYDISNIQGKFAVGSMVVANGGFMAKSQYRKFKINSKDTPDDFLMMNEVLERRFNLNNKKEDASFLAIPDLIIIDGGKGQLSSASEILEKLNLKIPIVGLAKKEEIIIWQTEDGFRSYRLKDKSEEKFLIQRIRDEAHRFAINYHRNLRSSSEQISKLDEIPGVGPTTKKKLLIEFKSVVNIRRAGRKSLMKVVNNKRTVENIMKYL